MNISYIGFEVIFYLNTCSEYLGKDLTQTYSDSVFDCIWLNMANISDRGIVWYAKLEECSK